MELLEQRLDEWWAKLPVARGAGRGEPVRYWDVLLSVKSGHIAHTETSRAWYEKRNRRLLVGRDDGVVIVRARASTWWEAHRNALLTCERWVGGGMQTRRLRKPPGMECGVLPPRS